MKIKEIEKIIDEYAQDKKTKLSKIEEIVEEKLKEILEEISNNAS